MLVRIRGHALAPNAGLSHPAVLLMLVLVGCEQGSDGAEVGTTVDDLQQEFDALRDDFGAMNDRLTVLEDDSFASTAGDAAGDDAMNDPASTSARRSR